MDVSNCFEWISLYYSKVNSGIPCLLSIVDTLIVLEWWNSDKKLSVDIEELEVIVFRILDNGQDIIIDDVDPLNLQDHWNWLLDVENIAIQD